MTTRATGTFEVKMSPLAVHDEAVPVKLARMSIDKRLHGDLDATSRGEMLAMMTDTQGSAGYVAIERVTGRLHGREGSFVLQHSSTMARGVPQQSIQVIPDSGTGDLAGLAGSFVIEIRDKQHFYTFDYTLDVAK